jgi:hypothetical protein
MKTVSRPIAVVLLIERLMVTALFASDSDSNMNAQTRTQCSIAGSSACQMNAAHCFLSLALRGYAVPAPYSFGERSNTQTLNTLH